MVRRRLDDEMVRRGLAADATEARAAIRSGAVTVGGAPVRGATTLVAADQPLHVRPPRSAFVSRGGVKLDAALARFGIDPAGRSCLDAGSSTGGFTDRLLQGGAVRVAAVDVGYGQLAWRIRTDPRVRVLERTDVRRLTVEMLGFRPDLVVADLSFISIASVVGELADVASADATFVVLIKPQFEAGDGVEAGGVVRDPRLWRSVLERAVDAFLRVGIAPLGLIASPVLGPAGNVEFLLHARRGARGAGPDIGAAVQEAVDLRDRSGSDRADEEPEA